MITHSQDMDRAMRMTFCRSLRAVSRPIHPVKVVPEHGLKPPRYIFVDTRHLQGDERHEGMLSTRRRSSTHLMTGTATARCSDK